MSRKSRRERAAKASSPQNQATTPQQPAASRRSSRPAGVILVLGVLVIGGLIFAVYLFIREGLPATREPSPGPYPVVVMETSEGNLTIELFEKDAPITVKNFLTYVDEKFYDGTLFHRVIPDFMIQGGGFEPGMVRKKEKHPTIRNEAGNGLSNRRGTLAMARTDEPDSASSEFFINVVDNLFLDRNQAKDRVGYAVFGRVIQGMEVADRIRYTPTLNERPRQDVIVKSVRRAEPKQGTP